MIYLDLVDNVDLNDLRLSDIDVSSYGYFLNSFYTGLLKISNFTSNRNKGGIIQAIQTRE
jgi:hypothetical protein